MDIREKDVDPSLNFTSEVGSFFLPQTLPLVNYTLKTLLYIDRVQDFSEVLLLGQIANP